MLHIISRGLGYLVAVIGFGFALLFNLACNAYLGEAYWDMHKWPLGVSLLLSAIVCWFLGNYLRQRDSQIVIDKVTGEEIILERGEHTLYFLPMHAWSPIFAAGGLAAFAYDILK